MISESGPYVSSEILYQFCSVTSFRNIIASKQIWYTDLESANDPRELKLGRLKFIEALKFVVENEYEGRSRDLFLRMVEGEEAEGGPEHAQCFSASFSLLNDELPMWREYGDNYRGVAIGFCPATISSMPGIIQKVSYLSNDSSEDFRNMAREILRKHSAPGIALLAAALDLTSIATAVKHRTWEYEREVRLVFRQSRTPHDGFKKWPDGTKIFWETPLSRMRGAERIEYKAFPFAGRKPEDDRSRAIAAVVIGPRCELAFDDVKLELEKNRFEDFRIVRSECEIR